MPVKMREHRYSLNISRHEREARVKSRPRSCVLSSGGDVDPYTSVRKIFYEFPKKDFFGNPDINKNLFHICSTEDLRRNMFNDAKLALGKPESSVKASPPSQRACDENNLLRYKNGYFPSYLTNKSADSISLKEGSSTYAEFYVPHAQKTTKSNFLRRNPKRRSFDPSKYTDGIDYDVLQALGSSFLDENFNKYVSDSSSPKISSSPQNPKKFDGIEMKPTQSYIPWTKRSSLLEAKIFLSNIETPIKSQRSSLGLSKTCDHIETQRKMNFPSLRRSKTTLTDTIRLGNRTKRNSSVSSSLRTRRTSTTSLISRQTPEPHRRVVARNSFIGEHRAISFFLNYEDRLRNEALALEYPTSPDLQMLSCARTLYPELLKQFDHVKSYHQIGYVRSRLSNASRKVKFKCGGWFGCTDDHVVYTPAIHWI